MKCTLCKKTIMDYNEKLNHLNIDECVEVEICRGCTEKILEWQQKLIAELFPTKAIKKRFGK